RYIPDPIDLMLTTYGSLAGATPAIYGLIRMPFEPAVFEETIANILNAFQPCCHSNIKKITALEKTQMELARDIRSIPAIKMAQFKNNPRFLLNEAFNSRIH